MKILIIILLLFPNLVFAQTYTAIDNSDVGITNTQSITDIQTRIGQLQGEKAKWDSQYDSLISTEQAKIDQAALAGVATAVPLASQTVQDEIAASTVTAQPATVLDPQGTVKISLEPQNAKHCTYEDGVKVCRQWDDA